METTGSTVLHTIDEYNPVFSGLGRTDRASIPLGNGELCANAWVETDGLHFYLARSDAITELDRTVKLGEYIVRIEPNPFLNANDVRQELVLRDGVLRVQGLGLAGGVSLEFFIDAESDDAYVRVESDEKFDITVELRAWRDDRNYSRDAVGMFWGDEDVEALPELADVFESADQVITRDHHLVGFHQNQGSIVGGVVAMHELTQVIDQIPDLLIGRVFGSQITLTPNSQVCGSILHSTGVKKAQIRVATFSSQTRTLGSILDSIQPSFDAQERLEATARYWNKYWERSWIFIDGDTPAKAKLTAEVEAYASGNGLPKLLDNAPSTITRAYLLTKWMTACASRGAMPILYNGSLFTTMPGAGCHLRLDSFSKAFSSEPTTRPTLALNPDERTWTLEHLWQNVRLPYYSMLARGEYEGLKPLFAYYRRFWDLNRARARLHYGARGQWNTEMTLSCGLQSPGVYGASRAGLPVGWSKNRWGGAINISPGLELCKLQFDYWKATRDDDFLRSDFLPFALDLIDFASSKFLNEETQKIEFTHLNSIETYFDCFNPVAIVSGYRRLAHDLLSLPDEILNQRKEVEEFSNQLPEVPTGLTPAGETCIAPAAVYAPVRMNVESPELYAIYPFDLRFEIPQVMLEATWRNANRVSGAFRPAVLGEKLATQSYSGWQYHGPVAARLGLVQECLEVLSNNSVLTNPGFAFPAMWGPIYDAVPDVDHGANIMNTLQDLVLEILAKPDLARYVPTGIGFSFKIFRELGDPVVGSIRNGQVLLSE